MKSYVLYLPCSNIPKNNDLDGSWVWLCVEPPWPDGVQAQSLLSYSIVSDAQTAKTDTIERFWVHTPNSKTNTIHTFRPIECMNSWFECMNGIRFLIGSVNAKPPECQTCFCVNSYLKSAP